MASPSSRSPRPGAALDPQGRPRMADRPREWYPVADVLETATHFVVRINLPGLQREQIRIQLVDDSTLVVRGAYGADSVAEEATYLLAERPRVAVERIIHLSSPVVAEEVEATLDLGVLTVHLPKHHRDEQGPRQIPIH
ncbi:Hsp20/alpha crystallin family protein [Candidatus Sumerlaeota bacterium]|nr:Hsp20/alpha crystallin family protein [Candidatus Sumerlaeota bacterium]